MDMISPFQRVSRGASAASASGQTASRTSSGDMRRRSTDVRRGSSATTVDLNAVADALAAAHRSQAGLDTFDTYDAFRRQGAQNDRGHDLRPSSQYLQAQADLARVREALEENKRHNPYSRSTEQRRSYERARASRDKRRSEDRRMSEEETRGYQERINTAEGPHSEVRTSLEGRAVERASGESRERTDSISDGSGREPLTMEQLADADRFGGLRTRSRAEIEMLKRAAAQAVHSEHRADSAPAVVMEHGSIAPPSSRRSSHTIINVNLADHDGGGNEDRTIRRQSTLRWPDALTPDTNSRRYKYAVLAMQSAVALVLGAASIVATYLSARNAGHIADNRDIIDQLQHPPPPPPGR